MFVHANTYQMTAETIYRFTGSDATSDGDLHPPIENERNDMVPFLMTPTVVQSYAPLVLDSFKPSESHGDLEFGFCTASTKLNLRDLILLDNQSTVNIFCNKRLLKGIHISADHITIYGNGGALIANQKGTLRNYGEVWYHADAITNILSLKRVRSKFKLTYVSHPIHQ